MTTLSPDEMLWMPGMTFLQHHRTRHLQMKVRFKMWDAIMESPAPAEGLHHARGMWSYAQGRALAATGHLEEAREHLEQVRAASIHPDIADVRLEFNTSGAVLTIASEVLAGHLAAAESDLSRAASHLRQAARLEDDLVYGEPPDWTVPVRQELGVLLLKADRPKEAEEVFREDLHRFPANGWSLHGLAEALAAQGKDSEAATAMAEFKAMWAGADVEPPAGIR
jgi:predicted Zn-dependent protease